MARRELTDEQKAELEDLRLRCELVFDFLETKLGISSVQPFRATMEETFAERALGDMRILWKDAREWLKEISPMHRAELISILKAKTAVDFTVEGDREQAAIQRIVLRNRIRTTSEYRRVLARVESIYHDPASQGEIETLNHLLAEYHRSKGEA